MKYGCADGMQITLRRRTIRLELGMEDEFMFMDNGIVYHRKKHAYRREADVTVSGL